MNRSVVLLATTAIAAAIASSPPNCAAQSVPHDAPSATSEKWRQKVTDDIFTLFDRSTTAPANPPRTVYGYSDFVWLDDRYVDPAAHNADPRYRPHFATPDLMYEQLKALGDGFTGRIMLDLEGNFGNTQANAIVSVPVFVEVLDMIAAMCPQAKVMVYGLPSTQYYNDADWRCVRRAQQPIFDHPIVWGLAPSIYDLYKDGIPSHSPAADLDYVRRVAFNALESAKGKIVLAVATDRYYNGDGYPAKPMQTYIMDLSDEAEMGRHCGQAILPTVMVNAKPDRVDGFIEWDGGEYYYSLVAAPDAPAGTGKAWEQAHARQTFPLEINPGVQPATHFAWTKARMRCILRRAAGLENCTVPPKPTAAPPPGPAVSLRLDRAHDATLVDITRSNVEFGVLVNNTNDVNGDGDYDDAGDYLATSRNVKISNLTARNCTLYGAYLGDVHGWTISDSLLHLADDAREHGFRAAHAHGLDLLTTTIDSSGGHKSVLWLLEGSKINLVGCTLIGGEIRLGVRPEDGFGTPSLVSVTIRGCTIRNNREGGAISAFCAWPGSSDVLIDDCDIETLWPQHWLAIDSRRVENFHWRDITVNGQPQSGWTGVRLGWLDSAGRRMTIEEAQAKGIGPLG